MHCVANTYFCLILSRISLFVQVPFYPVCLYFNLRGFGLRTRISSFVRVTFSPVCMSFDLHGFGLRLSVSVSLFPVRRALTLSPNKLIQ